MKLAREIHLALQLSTVDNDPDHMFFCNSNVQSLVDDSNKSTECLDYR